MKSDRVTDLGGIFFKANDAVSLMDWYEAYLGIRPEWAHGARFHWRDENDPMHRGMTVWSLFRRDSAYFGDGGQP